MLAMPSSSSTVAICLVIVSLTSVLLALSLRVCTSTIFVTGTGIV